MGSPVPEELAAGLWTWACPHPEWRSGEFGAEVVSFAARADEVLLLIDPLLPAGADAGPVLELIDAEAERAARVAILLTIPLHARSSEQLWRRLGRDGGHAVSIHGHPAVSKRLTDATAAFVPSEPGAELPGGAIPHAIGRPRRYEMPLHLPSHDAVVFGDSVAGVGGGLRVWSEKRADAKVEAFYRERFNPTLEPLAALEPRRVLVTHGPSVLENGATALREALAAPPWYHHG